MHDQPNPLPIDTEVLPDVATSPHPTAHPTIPGGPAEGGALQDVLPDIREVARKVGGFKKLSEIASQLDPGDEQ